MGDALRRVGVAGSGVRMVTWQIVVFVVSLAVVLMLPQPR